MSIKTMLLHQIKKLYYNNKISKMDNNILQVQVGIIQQQRDLEQREEHPVQHKTV
jgi:hypothetical protein